MVWKQDLAKLKQDLKEAGPGPQILPPKPPAPVPSAEPRSMEEEDALFLRSMGRPAPYPTVLGAGREPLKSEPLPPPPPQDSPATFLEAMEGLEGLQRMGGSPLPPVPQVPQVPPLPIPTPEEPKSHLISNLLAASEETRPLDAPPPPPETLKQRGPVLIQLAAGMAIEVDGFLDLRNHTLTDARERLKERLEDAGMLAWRSVHVVLGPSEALRQGFLAFLTTPGAKGVTRYAQAPIPMGGNQAWVLYLGSSAS